MGPGKVLSGLVKHTSREVQVLNIEDAESLQATLGAVGL
jgi:hypothetical protein